MVPILSELQGAPRPQVLHIGLRSSAVAVAGSARPPPESLFTAYYPRPSYRGNRPMTRRKASPVLFWYSPKIRVKSTGMMDGMFFVPKGVILLPDCRTFVAP